MRDKLIEKFAISNVYQEKMNDAELIIYFRLDTYFYSLYMMKSDGIYAPSGVYHESEKGCVVCGCGSSISKGFRCYELSSIMPDLFDRLIEHPSIRLEWLFILHEERGNEDENI